jgi:hypothetical protein
LKIFIDRGQLEDLGIMDFRVISAGLNIRSSGVVEPNNIIAVLPQNQIVTRIGNESDNDKWWQVRTTLMGRIIEGFVNKSFLASLLQTKDKVLWVVSYPSLEWFIDRATFIKATAVAIRTDNDMETAISAFHAKGIKVYGWRWPSAQRARALKEAKRVVELLSRGLDGYYVDPEGEEGKHYDWDQPDLDKIAEEFCHQITMTSPSKVFGTTSHFRGGKIFTQLPWKVFIKYSNILLPQAYWRVKQGTVSGGNPEKNYLTALDEWQLLGGARNLIVPMAGELEHANAAEIESYAEAAKMQGVSSLHFYTATEAVKSDVWKAIANLQIA